MQALIYTGVLVFVFPVHILFPDVLVLLSDLTERIPSLKNW
jgi:hypothetical protein